MTGLVGLASFGLIVAGTLISPPLWDAPSTTSPAADVAAYFQDNRTRIIAGLFVFSIGLGLFMCFAAALWGWLRRIEPEPRPLSATFAFAGVALTGLVFAGFVPAAVGAYRPQPPAIAGLLADLTFGLLAMSAVPTAVMLGAYAEIVWRHRWLPMWTAWLALVGVAAHVLIAASFFSQRGILSLEGIVIVWVPATFFVWILAVSLVLLGTQHSSGIADT
jgi:hypothetical protein